MRCTDDQENKTVVEAQPQNISLRRVPISKVDLASDKGDQDERQQEHSSEARFPAISPFSASKQSLTSCTATAEILTTDMLYCCRKR